MNRVLVVDASYCHEIGYAGIAVAELIGGCIRRADVIPAESANDAETLAAIRGVQSLVTERSDGGRILTDSAHVGQLRGDSEAMRELKAMIRNHGISLEAVYRGYVRPAHIAARAMLRAYKAGRAEEMTWTRTPYLKEIAVV